MALKMGSFGVLELVLCCLATATVVLAYGTGSVMELDMCKIEDEEALMKAELGIGNAIGCPLPTQLEYSPIEEDVTFWCINRKTDKFRSVQNDFADVSEYISAGLPTVFFVHGWIQNKSQFADNVQQLAKADADQNYCLLDFGRLAVYELRLFAHILLPRIATYFAGFIQSLSAIEITPDKVTIIGEGVSAHLAGYVGYVLSGRLGLIVGLDPIGPFFTTPVLRPKKYILDPSDAKFVQVGYTSIGQLGSTIPLGHQNIYINGGFHPQPYCACYAKSLGRNHYLTELCSHFFAVKVLRASLDPQNVFIGTSCGSYEDFLRGRCEGEKKVRIGATILEAGNFYLETSCQPPFTVDGF